MATIYWLLGTAVVSFGAGFFVGGHNAKKAASLVATANQVASTAQSVAADVKKL